MKEKHTSDSWINSVTKEALPLVAREVLRAGVRHPSAPQLRARAHGGCGAAGGALLARRREGVVVEEPAAVHHAAHPHRAAQARHQRGYLGTVTTLNKVKGTKCNN